MFPFRAIRFCDLGQPHGHLGCRFWAQQDWGASLLRGLLVRRLLHTTLLGPLLQSCLTQQLSAGNFSRTRGSFVTPSASPEDLGPLEQALGSALWTQALTELLSWATRQTLWPEVPSHRQGG